jgi:hypothetical protein
MGLLRVAGVCAIVPAVLIWPGIAEAQRAPRDRAAERKIEEASGYVAGGEIQKAEPLLLGTLRACGDRCSPGVKARILMLVGILRADAHGDEAAARVTFSQALDLDPCVEIDSVLAGEPAERVFRELVTFAADPSGDPAAAPLRPGCPAQEVVALPAPVAPPAPEEPPRVAVTAPSAPRRHPVHTRYRDAHADRVVFFPTAETHPSGTFFVSDYEIALLQLGYAPADFLQLSTMLAPPLTGERFRPSVFDATLKVKAIGGPLQLAGIGAVDRMDFGNDTDASWIGRVGAVGQVCIDDDCGVSVSVNAQAMVPFDADQDTLLAAAFGVTAHVGDSFALLVEPSTFSPQADDGDEGGSVLSYGFRLSGSQFGLDFVFVRPLWVEDTGFVLGLPFLAFTGRTASEPPRVARRSSGPDR